MIARSTGAAPRQRGSSEGCTLSISWADSSGSRISAPNAHTQTASGRAAAIRSRGVGGALTFSGWIELEPERARGVGHRRRGEPPPAAARAVGAGDDERRAVARWRQALEHGGGEGRGAEVDGAHAVRL